MASTGTAHQLHADRSGSAALRVAAIAVAALLGSLALLAHGGIDAARTAADTARADTLDVLGAVLAVCSTAPLLVWRRSPFGVLAATVAASVLLVGLGYPFDLMFGPTAALYLLAAGRDQATRWTWAASTAVAGLFTAYAVTTSVVHGAVPVVGLLHNGLAWALAWFAGERTRLRHEHIVDLSQRAERTERDAERERRLAAAEERARIARDLHDSAGHAISVIAVRAGAARLRHAQDPDRSLRALEVIEDLARQTVDEIDHMVATLREDNPGGDVVEAPPGLASLDTLIARHTGTGLAVTVDTIGVPRTLAGAADRAAYRILQEALTNASRHGAGSAGLNLAFGDAALELIVTNPVRPNGVPRTGGGHGLIGMHERATLLGGSLDTERANGAFRVRATIPYAGHRP